MHYFFFQAEDGIRDFHVTGVQTCALPIFGATESRAVGGVEGADGQASPAAHLSLQVLRRVPAGAAAAGGDRDAAASDDPDAGARARRTAREIGRASCRERVEMEGVAASLR